MITNPYIWEEERAKRIKEKIDKERESRIRGKKKVAVKVNRKLAERLLEKQEKEERRRAQKVLERGGDEDMVDAPAASEEPGKGLLGDSRFRAMFEDEEFAVDENSKEFKLLNPGSVREESPRKERGLTAVEQEEVDSVPSSSSDDDESSSESEDEQPEKKSKPSEKTSNKGDKKKPTLQMQVSSSTKAGPIRDRSFESRAQKMRVREKTVRGSVVGEKEVTFAPKPKSKPQPRAESAEAEKQYREKERRSASKNTFRRM